MKAHVPWLDWRTVDPLERAGIVAFARSQRLVDAVVHEAAGKAAKRKAAAEQERRRG